MHIDYINISLGFLEGFALIISPCILPILPLILSSSIDGNKKRPYGIILGFVVIFTLFTLFSRQLVLYTGINLTSIRHISYGLLLLFGIIMISSYLSEKFSLATQRLGNIGNSLANANSTKGGMLDGFIFGGLVGFIWTPCAGPILATIIVQTVLQQTSLNSFLVLLFFGIGAATPMLLIALLGRKIMSKFQIFKSHAYFIRKILGFIIILSVGYMIYSETALANVTTTTTTRTTELSNGLSDPYPAPEITNITTWINSSPLQINELKGKVVLIDFWTYSCINCIRTLPYIKEWYQKYHNKGLIIIGVHAPEFEFEHNINNVKNAVKKFGILYPVALDNDFSTWRNYHNRFWPAHYLIDKNGKVVYQHFGEGEYDTTENNIRYLLGVSGEKMIASEESFTSSQTPETYLGSARAENFASPESMITGKITHYTFPEHLTENQWALNGSWLISPEKITATQPYAAIKIHFYAKKVFIVMGNPVNKPITLKVLLDNKPVVDNQGSDVKNSEITVKENRLYEVINLDAATSGILELITSDSGLEVYTFTFG